MRFFIENSSKKRAEWRRWFAWHPVEIKDGHFIWLEYVERRGETDMESIQWWYREPIN